MYRSDELTTLDRALGLESIQDLVVVSEESARQGILLERVVKGMPPRLGGLARREAPDAVERPIPEENHANLFWAWPDERSGGVAARQRFKPQREWLLGVRVGGHHPGYRVYAHVS